MGKVLARVPSAVFAPSVQGAPRYTVADRAACLGVKFLEYSLAGMACGFVGQGVANGLMQIKCAETEPPPAIKLHASSITLPARTSTALMLLLLP